MITNFEDITEKLSIEELRLLDIIIKGIDRRSEKNPVKEAEIVKAINENKERYGLKRRFNGVRLRKLINIIRSNGLLPLIGTSKGYYTNYNKPVIEKQIQSLQERSDRILRAANGLKKFLK